MTDDEMMAAVRQAFANRQVGAGGGQGIHLGAPPPGGLPPGMASGPTSAGLMPPTMGGPPGGPAPQLGGLIGQQPGGMGGPGTISATPLPPPGMAGMSGMLQPMPGMPQPPMTPATPMATGGGTGAGMAAAPGVTGNPSGSGWNMSMGAPVPQPRPFVPFGQSSNLADYFSQPRPAATAGMAPQQARQGMGPPAPSFGQSRYLMDYLARMFGRG